MCPWGTLGAERMITGDEIYGQRGYEIRRTAPFTKHRRQLKPPQVSSTCAPTWCSIPSIHQFQLETLRLSRTTLCSNQCQHHAAGWYCIARMFYLGHIISYHCHDVLIMLIMPTSQHSATKEIPARNFAHPWAIIPHSDTPPIDACWNTREERNKIPVWINK